MGAACHPQKGLHVTLMPALSSRGTAFAGTAMGMTSQGSMCSAARSGGVSVVSTSPSPASMLPTPIFLQDTEPPFSCRTTPSASWPWPPLWPTNWATAWAWGTTGQHGAVSALAPTKTGAASWIYPQGEHAAGGVQHLGSGWCCVRVGGGCPVPPLLLTGCSPCQADARAELQQLQQAGPRARPAPRPGLVPFQCARAPEPGWAPALWQSLRGGGRGV